MPVHLPTESQIDRLANPQDYTLSWEPRIPREQAIAIGEARAKERILRSESDVFQSQAASEAIKRQLAGEGVKTFPPGTLPPPSTEETVLPGALGWLADKLGRIPSAITGGVLESTKPPGVPRDIPAAMWRGFSGQTRPHYSQVLQAAGVPKLGRMTVSPRLTSGYSELRAMGYSEQTAKLLSATPTTPDIREQRIRENLAAEVPGSPGLDPTRIQITGRGALGLAMDMAFDPQMYVSFGTGRALKVGELIGERTVPLSPKGFSRLRDIISGQPAPTTLTDKILVQTNAQRQILQEIASGSTEFVHPGGIAFGGAHIPGSQVITKGARAGVSVIDSILKRIPVERRGGPIAQAIGKLPHELPAQAGISPLPRASAHDLLVYLRSVFDRDALVAKWEPFIWDKQHFLNLRGASQRLRVKEAEEMFRGTTPHERMMIYRAAEGVEPTSGMPWQGPLTAGQTPSQMTMPMLPDHLQAMAMELRTRLDALRALDASYGLGGAYLDDYMFHAYVYHPKNRERVWGALGINPNLLASRERTFPTLWEAKQAGMIPRTEDAAEAYVIRAYASDRARLTRDMIQSTAAKYGVPQATTKLHDAIDKEMASLPFAEEAVGHPIYVPKPLADDLERMVAVGFISNPVARAAIQKFDSANNFVKGSVTSIFPAFQIGNAYSNPMLAWLHSGLSALNPLRHLEATEILTGKTGVFHTRTGITYSYDEVRKFLEEENLLGAFRHRIELMGETKRQLREPIPQIWQDPHRTLGQKVFASGAKVEPYYWGRLVGSAFEDEARSATFLAHLKRGASPARAAAEAKTALFDYENLSFVEREVFRRLFMFYTFPRKNIELQARALFTEPGRQTLLTKIFQVPGSEDEGKELARYYPVWLHDGMILPTGLKDPQGNPIVISGLRLPVEDFNKIFAPAPSGEGVEGQVRRTIQKTFLSQLHPVMRGVLESTLKRNLFTGSDLSQKQRVYDIVEKAPEWLQKWLEAEPHYTLTGQKTYRANPVKVQAFLFWTFNRFYTTSGQLFNPDETEISRFVHLLAGPRIEAVPIREQALERGAIRAGERARQSQQQETQAIRQLLHEPRPVRRPGVAGH